MYEIKNQEAKQEKRQGRKRAVVFLLIASLCLWSVPPFGMVEEAHGETLTGAVSLTVEYAGKTGICTGTLDTSSGALTFDTCSIENIVPSNPLGDVSVTVAFSGVTGAALNVTGGTGDMTGGCTIPYVSGGMTVSGSVSCSYFDGTAEASSNGGDFSVTLVELPPPSPWEVNINGEPCSLSEEAIVSGQATVNSPNLTIYIRQDGSAYTTKYTLKPSSGAPISMTPDSSDGGANCTLPGEGTYNIGIEAGGTSNKGLKLAITYRLPPPPSSGGSSKPSEPPAKVVNQENTPNQSSDTILTPNGTQSSEGTSTTNVSSNEMEALLTLVEEHKDDVPEGEQEAIIQIEDGEGTENENYQVSMPGADFHALANSAADVVVVKTSIGDFRIKAGGAKGLGTHGAVEIILRKMDNDGKPGLDAQLLNGGENISDFEGKYMVEIRIPYIPEEGEDLSALVIEYIRPDGTKVLITESRYDPESQCVIFFATHLSKYGVAYRPKLFKDVKSTHWANGAITFLAARQVISGSGDGRFRPDDKVSKAEFLSMMTTAFSAASLGKKAVKSYRDVPTNAWYAKSVGWSYLNNISNPIAKNGMLYPLQALSREDMAVLSNNISLSLGLKLKEKKKAVVFKDQKSIAAYAVPGVTRMSQCGIVSGNQSGKFMPKSGLTRAEAASIISTLMAGMR